MTKTEKIFKNYLEVQDIIIQDLGKTLNSLNDLSELNIVELYPKFQIKEGELIGYFNPYVTGAFDRLGQLGMGASILTLMPFYERIIVQIERISQDWFLKFYGIDFSQFCDLVKSGRILPLLPSTLNAFPYFGGEQLDYLSQLWEEKWPSDDRPFRLTRLITMQQLKQEREAEIIKDYTQLMFKASKEIFNSPGARFNFIRLCNRCLYRGDPSLIVNWINLAMKHKQFFQAMDAKLFRDNWEIPTLYTLDVRDRSFTVGLQAPGSSAIYTSIGFDWLQHEIENTNINTKRLKLRNLEPRIREELNAASKAINFEQLAVLRKEFLYEPIEAVGDLSKYLHWLEHSVNVQENQRLMREFGEHLRKAKYKKAVTHTSDSIEEIVKELNTEISHIDFDVKASIKLVKTATTVASAVAGAALGNALSSGELAALFSMCGALAASKLTEEMSKEIVKGIGKIVYRNSAPFLIWKNQEDKK